MLNYNVTKEYEVVRSEECRCSSCGERTTVSLLREVRTVSVLIVISQVEYNYHLACAGCQALFHVRRDRATDGRHTIDELMGMAGRREFPLVIPFVFLVWIACLPIPLAPLVVAWKQNAHRIYFGDLSRKLFTALLVISVGLNLIWLTYIVVIIIQGHPTPPPE